MMPLFNLIFAIPLIPDSLNPLNTGPLPGMPEFISDLFPTLVKVVAALAVLTIAYWGIRYILSGIPGIKSFGQERMWSALLGLLLALSAYLILDIINPNIIQSLRDFTGSN